MKNKEAVPDWRLFDGVTNFTRADVVGSATFQKAKQETKDQIAAAKSHYSGPSSSGFNWFGDPPQSDEEC